MGTSLLIKGRWRSFLNQSETLGSFRTPWLNFDTKHVVLQVLSWLFAAGNDYAHGFRQIEVHLDGLVQLAESEETRKFRVTITTRRTSMWVFRHRMRTKLGISENRGSCRNDCAFDHHFRGSGCALSRLRVESSRKIMIRTGGATTRTSWSFLQTTWRPRPSASPALETERILDKR
ncbi:hypothetical protein RvY_13388-3 [Ramazzottius varieornatus]|uniref:Uncharacterized protein n=1 Tax=Ramazzottius varieornatus TaxID=947166 RepID=A0A1D1VMP0_RAMVA|nr:hypothetical protein RvY_13388-3 [Ramazzottius varieornatus]